MNGRTTQGWEKRVLIRAMLKGVKNPKPKHICTCEDCQDILFQD